MYLLLLVRFVFIRRLRPPGATLFPYTTLFRSVEAVGGAAGNQRRRAAGDLEAGVGGVDLDRALRSEEHTSELQSRETRVCGLLLEKKDLIAGDRGDPAAGAAVGQVGSAVVGVA